MIHGFLVAAFLGGPLAAAEEWEPILEQALKEEHSQTRQDGLKQVDASTVKGLKAIWAVLAIRDPNKVDWYVREGAYEALSEAKGAEAEKEIERIIKDSRTSASSSDGEVAKEAIVYAVVWKIRKAVVRALAGNDERKMAEVKYRLRKARGAEYFGMVLPTIRQIDPEKKYLGWIQSALADKSPRARRAAITGLMVYPDHSSIPLLIDNLKKLEKQKSKNLREWVLTRGALETLTGQYFRDIVEDWARWWDIEKDKFTIEKRVEENSETGEGSGRTVVVRKEGIEVKVNMKVAGAEGGYPLLVLPWRGYEVDYFRPYFHGIEEICKVYYVRMPLIEDYKGIAREASSNFVQYPTQVLATALVDLMQQTGLSKFALLAHGPDAGHLSMLLASKHPDRVSHMILINPRSGGDVVGRIVEGIKREGMRLGNKELVKASDAFFIMQDGKPKYQASDDAEAGGMSRALHHNLFFADPTEPETGEIDYLYELPGGTSVLIDDKWTAKSIIQGKAAEIPTLIIAGEKALWTPVNDQAKVASLFKRASLVKMPSSAETPFISETGLFTKSIEDFMRPALVAQQKEKKDKEKAKKDEEAKGKTKVGK
jgi:pimeloyl-ACP methyl ester carboxylesterase